MKKKQLMDVLAIPNNEEFIVDPKKTKKFLSQEPNLEIRKSNEDTIKKLNDSQLFSDELIETIEKKSEENSLATTMRRMIDGDPKNINPLEKLPEAQKRLYGFSGLYKSAYFDTEDELIEYIKTNNTQFGSICVIEYLGNVAGKSDVIRKIYRDNKSVLYAVVDEDGYVIYNNERSIYRGEFVWEYNHGKIESEYSAFRDRGIVFENDIYVKIEQRNKKIYKMMDDIFNKKTKK